MNVSEIKNCDKQLDELDSLSLIDMVENPNLFEDCILLEHSKAKNNTEAAALLNAIFLSADRNADFERFLKTRDFAVTLKILKFFKDLMNTNFCEIGGGSGILTWAMMKSDLQCDLFEPNKNWITGTGYLNSRLDSRNINIYNDNEQWHGANTLYDALITKNCIHHFKNITLAAVILRQKLKKGGLWYSFREWFADTPREVADAIALHPYSQPYKLYEWPYPAAHYAEAIELAGFKLIAVIPAGYENNCLGTYSEDPYIAGDTVSQALDQTLRDNPEATVSAFWQEVAQLRAGDFSVRLYTRPQAMIFEKARV